MKTYFQKDDVKKAFKNLKEMHLVMVRKSNEIYRWTTVTRETRKILKPFDVMSIQI